MVPPMGPVRCGMAKPPSSLLPPTATAADKMQRQHFCRAQRALPERTTDPALRSPVSFGRALVHLTISHKRDFRGRGPSGEEVRPGQPSAAAGHQKCISGSISANSIYRLTMQLGVTIRKLWAFPGRGEWHRLTGCKLV